MIFLCKKACFLCCAHRNLLFSRTIKNNPYFLDTCGDHRYNFTVDTLLIYYVKALK